MKLLLDTHTFLWLVEGSPNLSTAAAVALTDPTNELFLSVGSAWEIAIKRTSQKLALTDPLDAYVTKWSTIYQIALVLIEFPHILVVAALPDYHRDPFDRLLIATALVEGMTLVSADTKFTAYPVPILW